jgi:hypothetical protein
MDLEKQFHKDMVSIYEKAKKDCNYVATRFIQMVAEKGGLITAKELIIKDEDTYGFTRLYELGRLDLSVEALALDDKYKSLFSDHERICYERLKKYGYEIKKSSH